MKEQEYRKRFVKLFDRLSAHYDRQQIWSDFITMAACSIANAVHHPFWDEREQRYLNCVKRYSKEDVADIVEMFTIVMEAYTDDLGQDFLGSLFGTLNLHNEWRGQFFTPFHVAELMSKLTNGSEVTENDPDRPFQTVCDPCCGAGCLLIAHAYNEHQSGRDYRQNTLYYAQDIDYIATMMCYIQLSIIGCAAIVKVGNSLMDPIKCDEEISSNIWLTPMCYSEHWRKYLFEEKKEVATCVYFD